VRKIAETPADPHSGRPKTLPRMTKVHRDAVG
jgi:hypothetical protein